MLKVPATAGVPDMAPDEALRVSPGGSWPETTATVYGGAPPATEMDAE